MIWSPGPPGCLKSTYPRWQHLVNGYVEALGLNGSRCRGREAGLTCRADPKALPVAGEGFATGVRFDGCLYLREDDGLAWSLG